MISEANEEISLEDFQIKVIRSARRKTLSIELSNGGVIARAPKRMSLRSIKQFVNCKKTWIEKHLADRPADLPPLELIDGARLNFFEYEYSLSIYRGRGDITINQNKQIVVPIVQSHLPIEKTVLRKLVKWYKLQAALEFHSMAFEHAAIMFPTHKTLKIIGPGDISVRDYKRRWGSCNHRGELAFNWRLIMAPKTVCEYVVVHELAHRKEFNHSPQFWQIVEQQIPNWRDSRDWLAQHGRRLYRF